MSPVVELSKWQFVDSFTMNRSWFGVDGDIVDKLFVDEPEEDDETTEIGESGESEPELESPPPKMELDGGPELDAAPLMPGCW